METRNPELERLVEQARAKGTEDAWLAALKFLVDRLAAATGGSVDIGRYWIDEDHQSVSISVRVRAKQPFPGVASDYWEGVIALTGEDSFVWSDAYIFPFLENSVVTSRGRLADAAATAETDEFRHLQFETDQWRQRGWSSPDGPGEWAWVVNPGDEFSCDLDCRFEKPVFAPGEPLLVKASFEKLRARMTADQGKKQAGPVRLSLIHVNRGHQAANLAPWGKYPPPANGARVVRFERPASVFQNPVTVDLRSWKIRGGWTPGKYHLSIRAQIAAGECGHWSSVISNPLKFQIAV